MHPPSLLVPASRAAAHARAIQQHRPSAHRGTPRRRPRRASARPAFVALAALLGTLLCSGAVATAAPITVELRVEGSTATLYEGPVATTAENLETPSSGGAHPCNYKENGPSGGHEDEGNPAGTPTTALHDAALAGGLAFDAEWFGTGVTNGNPGDFFVTKVGSDVNESAPPYASWGFAVNYTTSNVGGCQIALAPGNEVLWAYNYFNLTHLLQLSGPASAALGTPFTVRVLDGHTGEPLAGAAFGEDVHGVTTPIPGSPLTDANGDATITLTHPGTVTLKATRADAVRSNGLQVCVHNGDDGTCGAAVAVGAPQSSIKGPPPLVLANTARAVGIRSGRAYRAHSAPRVLAGVVEVPAGGALHEVRIRLERRHGRRCYAFSGSRERFVRLRHCGAAAFFAVGASESFSYLLPAPLPAGRYSYDVQALDGANTPSPLVNGVSHVVFSVK